MLEDLKNLDKTLFSGIKRVDFSSRRVLQFKTIAFLSTSNGEHHQADTLNDFRQTKQLGKEAVREIFFYCHHMFTSKEREFKELLDGWILYCIH
jgi:hypothetical protein